MEAMSLNFTRISIATDMIPEQQDNQETYALLFRAGVLLPCLKAYVVSHMICQHKQTLTAMSYLEEVINQKVKV